MSVSDVGLRYISENAKNFIQDADNASNSVTRLNYSLASQSGSYAYEKALSRITNVNRSLTGSVNTLDKEINESSANFQRNSTAITTLGNSTNRLIGVQKAAISSTSKVIRVVGENAKDADTASQSIDKLGDGFNRIENTARIGAIGVAVFGRALGVPVAHIKLLNKGIDTFADKVDFLSDKFGDVAEKVDKADGEIQDYNKEQGRTPNIIEKVGSAFKENLPEIAAATVEVAKFGNAIRGFFQKDKGWDLPPYLSILAKNWSKLPPPIQATVAAIAAFKVTSFLLETFGKRAAAIDNISASFERLKASAGLADDFIENLAKTADNQLTQTELLVMSNRALAGSFGEFQTELANSLPLLLEFARVRAAATGEESDYLFQSLIEGIKKQEPEILDNMGLVVRLDEVYKSYAETLNVSADSLSAVQKQQAILSRVQSEAARNINILGEATLSNADRLKARENILGDMADNISLVFQPLLAAFLDIENYFLSLLGKVLQPLLNIFRNLFTIIQLGIQTVFNQLKPAFELIGNLLITFIAPFESFSKILLRLAPLIVAYFLAPFAQILTIIKTLNIVINILNPLLESMAFLFETIGDLVIGVIDFFSYLINVFQKFIVSAMQPLLNMFGIFNLSLETVKITITQTAQLLAVGFGKAVAALVNVMAGGAKEVLTIVANLAQGIADFLIGQSPPPKGPLSKIDEGGAATFEAWLDGFTSLSLKPVEQVASEVNTTLGDIGKLSLPQVEQRILKLDKALRPFEEQLSIVQSRFEAIQKPAEAALNAIDRQLDMAVEALTKGDETALNSVKALDAQRASIYKNLELQQQQVDFAQIQLALKQAQQSEERALLEIQKKRLSGQQLTTKEIQKEKAILDKQAQKEPKSGGSGTPANATGGVASSPSTNTTGSQFGDLILAGFESELDLSIYEEIGNQQERLGTEGARIGKGLAGLPDRFGEAFEGVFGVDGTIATFINDIFGPEGFFATKINEAIGEEGFIRVGFNNIFGSEGFLATQLSGIFGSEGIFATNLTNVQTLFTTFEANIGTTIDNIIGFFVGENSLETVLTNMFGEEGTIKTLMDSAYNLFTNMYNSVFGDGGIFSGVASRLMSLIASPIVLLLEGLETLINSFISYAESFLNGIIDNVEGLVQYIPTELRGSLNDLIGYQLVIPRVEFDAPAIDIKGAAKGGMFTGGMLQVGEKGKEYIAPASKIGVFPNNFVTAIESLENVLMSYMSIPSYNNTAGNNYYNNSNSTQTVNINQPMNPSSLRQQLNLMG